jgi:hypothetical protein
MVHVAVSDQTVKQLEKIASARSSSVEAVAEEAIREYVRAEAERLIELEAAAFRQLHPELLQKYLGEYVAIRQGALIDHDKDQAMLFTRVNKKYPDDIFLIRQVRPEVEETYQMRSPRIERA